MLERDLKMIWFDGFYEKNKLKIWPQIKVLWLILAKNAKEAKLRFFVHCQLWVGRVKKRFFYPFIELHSNKFKLSNLTHKYIYQNKIPVFLRFLFKALDTILWQNLFLNLPIFKRFSKKSQKFSINLKERYLNLTQMICPGSVWGLLKGSIICLKDI